MCVFPNLSRSVGGYENHQNARAHFSRRGIVIHLLIFHFFLSPMTGAFAKSSHIRAKLLCGSFERNSGMGGARQRKNILSHHSRCQVPLLLSELWNTGSKSPILF